MTRQLAAFIFTLAVCLPAPAHAGQIAPSGYKVLAPISHGSLTIFPVVAATSHDTSAFLTLDEGLRSGEVIVTEAGRITPLVRGRRRIPQSYGGGEVNRLMLVNNSDRPLLLLAGEIVTGGKQDRVIGKDRIVPGHSDPIDLSVFCVEPGRWTETSAQFKGLGVQMAQPSVRANAMGRKDQQAVWESVRESQAAAMKAAPAAGAVIGGTSSYATVMDNKEVQQQVDRVVAPVQRDYQSLIGELRARRAVGVVAAVRGQIVWADIFASTPLLEKYWPKLVRSYAAETLLDRAGSVRVDPSWAQQFIDDLQGRRQVSEVEPGVFRHTEISGDGYKVFELTSLLPKTGYDVHIAKAAQ